MGNSDALADTGRAKAFALQDSLKNGASIQAGSVRRRFRHGLEGLFATGRAEVYGRPATWNQIS